MSTYHKYFCINEYGAENLMNFGISFIIVACGIPRNLLDTSPLLSAIYALMLPLMSYMFSAAKQYNNPEGEGRAELILTWMVLVETNRIVSAPIESWGRGKSAEQLLRLAWVSFLVCTYSPTPMQGIRASLLVLCFYFFFFEIMKGIVSYKVKKSYLIGNNPELIHSYVKKKILGDDLRTTPMNRCNYIVMGEQNHEIDDSIYGYSLGKKKDNSEGMLTIGRVFQLNLPKADSCISLALAKLLRRRFAKIPVDEAEYRKGHDFVLKGLIGDIGGYRDTQTNSNDGEGNNRERVFRIIREELTIVYEYLHVRGPTYYYFPWYAAIFLFGILLVLTNGIYLIHITGKRSSAWVSHRGVEAFRQCFLSYNIRGYDSSLMVKQIYLLEQINTISLVTMGIFMVYCKLLFVGLSSDCSILFNLRFVEKYLQNSANPNRSCSSEAPSEYELPKEHEENADLVSENELPKAQGENADSVSENESPKAQGENTDSVAENELPKAQGENADSASENELTKAHRANVDSVSENDLPKSQGENADSVSEIELPKVTRPILRFMRYIYSDVLEGSTPYSLEGIVTNFFRFFCSVIVIADAEEAILTLLRESDGQLTNGETSLKKYGMEYLNWACKPNGSNTEAILLWHIATTFFHRHEPSPQQNNDPNQQSAPQQNNKPFTKEVALSLSSYCHYLVSCHPELLPDDVKWTKKMYANVTKDILSIPRSSDRCMYALLAMWQQTSVVGKGVTLAKELIKCAEEGTQVWTMLAHFWTEMMLFIAPSDNVEGHQKILHQKELITKLWALLTHAGIITRPKHTENQADESESNEIRGANYV